MRHFTYSVSLIFLSAFLFQTTNTQPWTQLNPSFKQIVSGHSIIEHISENSVLLSS